MNIPTDVYMCVCVGGIMSWTNKLQKKQNFYDKLIRILLWKTKKKKEIISCHFNNPYGSESLMLFAKLYRLLQQFQD